MNADSSTSWTLPDDFKVLMPWLVRIAELWGPAESKAFIKTLSKRDIIDLENVQKWFEQVKNRQAAERWCESVHEKESSGAMAILRLANLIDRLGEAGIHPFAEQRPINFGQRMKITPRDISGWPAELDYLKPLALKYGRIHSEQGLIDQTERLSFPERRKLCKLKKKAFGDSVLDKWIKDERNHDKAIHAVILALMIMLDHLECR